MAKRQKTDKSRLLNDLENITEKTAAATGADKGKTFSSDDIKPPSKKQDPDKTIKGRKKFTTMLHPDLRTKLDNVARNNQMSIADALEIIIKEYFGLK